MVDIFFKMAKMSKKGGLMYLGWLVLLAAILTPDQKQEIEDIDSQIRSSSLEKQRHEALATRYADTAFRLQTNLKVQDSKRYYEMEEQERAIANDLQREIEALERRKSDIMNSGQ